MSEKPAKRKLTVKWSKREKDHVIHYPADKTDLHFICGVFTRQRMRAGPNGWDFGPSVIEELEKRGYDTTTLRFEVSMREEK